MKKPTILLISSYQGFLKIYKPVLSGSFHVIAREALPDVADFILKRAGLILIINQWEYFPDFAIFDLAETTQLPVVILADTEQANLMQYAQRCLYLTVLVMPISNEQLLSALHKAYNETQSPRKQARRERDESAEKAFESAYKYGAFRQKIEKVIDFLHAHYADINSFQKLADSFDLNYESMKRAFEHKTGKLPQEYLREIRMEKMIQLVQFSRLTGEEIFIEVGYHDIPYAHKLFQEKYGIPIEGCIEQFRIAGKTG